jgi:hypothetical protein
MNRRIWPLVAAGIAVAFEWERRRQSTKEDDPMAALKDVTKATDEIGDLIEDLKNGIESSDTDFGDLAIVSERIADRASGLSEMFGSIGDTLDQAISGKSGSKSSRKDDDSESDEDEDDSGSSKSSGSGSGSKSSGKK